MFQIVENIINIAEKDDIAFYLRLLEDVFPYMKTYQYQSGMKQILSEMEVILRPEREKTVNDVALFYDYKAACEDNVNKAIKFEKEALELLDDINSGNAHLASNINANIGALYGKAKQRKLAKEHMGTGIQLLIEYNLTNTHDVIPQICNFASYLNDNKEFDATGMYSSDKNIFIDSLNKYSLLIIDDLGAERNSDFALEQVFSVIDTRYRSGKPLIVTTNLTIEEIKNASFSPQANIQPYSRTLCAA